MIDNGYIAIAFLGGIILGLFYYGALWLTVRRITRFSRPTLAIGTSFVLRAAIVVAAFYGLMRGDCCNLLAVLAGFIVGRYLFRGRLEHTHDWKAPNSPEGIS